MQKKSTVDELITSVEAQGVKAENVENNEKINVMKDKKREDYINMERSNYESVLDNSVANVAAVASVVDVSVATQYVEEIRAAKNSRLNIKSFNQLAKEGEGLGDLKKVFGNYILEKSTVLFPSERGVGKTLLGLQLAIKIANGEHEFLGEHIELNGNVLYANMELGERVMQKRLAQLGGINKESPYQVDCLTERSSLMNLIPELDEYFTEKKPVLVVVDNLRTAFSDQNNEKNQDMTKAIMELNNAKDKYGFALLLVHHTKKGTSGQRTNSDLQSGAGALTDLVDADFFLRKSQLDSTLRILKRVKSRECEEQEGAKLIRLNLETLWFEFVDEGIDEDPHIFVPEIDPKDMRDRIISLRDKGLSLQEIGDELGMDKSTVSRRLRKPM